ncbi:MAG: PQQ-dependent sugar dehydrogenase [Akkermansiaceae bacterium]
MRRLFYLSISLLVTGNGSADTLLSGQTIGIDFGGVAPVAGSDFNQYSDVDIADGATESFSGVLKNTDGGAVADVTFSVQNNTGQDSARVTLVTGEEGYGLMDDSSIYSDCIISNNTSGNPLTSDTGNPLTNARLTLTFSGLDDSLAYNLSGGWDNDNANFNATWISDGESATTNTLGNGFVSLTDLSTDGNGNLVINVVRDALHVTIASLQLTAVGLTNEDGGLNFPLSTPVGGYSFPDAFPGLTFTEIASLEALAGHPEKLFVVETRGVIWMIPDINAANPTKVKILDRSSVNTDRYFNGMGGVAFHPDFNNNGYFYVTYPSDNEGWTRVSRFTADPNNLGLVSNATEQVLIQENYHRSHGFNRLMFGPDGYLYIPVGDGKQVSQQGRPAAELTQTIDQGFWSSVLRIDVDKKSGNYEPQNLASDLADEYGNWTIPVDGSGLAHYSIPNDNPFLDIVAADGTGVSTSFGKATDPSRVRTEMYCYGFRNPWKIGFVPGTSDLWVADVMGSLKERYLIMPKGGNAGWAFYSGTGDVEWLQTTYGISAPQGFQYVQPVVEYYVTDSNSGANNKSIIGGEFYQSVEIPTLTNSFLMCDFNRGDIWAVHRDDHSAFQMVDPVLESANPDLYYLDDVGIQETTLGGVFAFGTYEASVTRLGSETGITAMLTNPTTGEMLLADSDDHMIRKVEYSAADFDSQLPQKLSNTGAFEDVENLETSAGMHAYDVNLSFWSDGAIKSRYLNMVDTTNPMQYSEDGFWEFPAGMVTMKHFDMDLDRDNPGTDVRRIETRFLVKTDDGFYGMTYEWNEAGTEATLVGDDGVNLELPIKEGGVTNSQIWRIPSRSECYQCHTSSNNVMLGLNTRQLNHDGELNGVSGNYLNLLQTAGYLTPIVSGTASLPHYSRPSEIGVNLEERVKSYLAVNCSYCHFEGNGLVPDSWSGEHFLTMEETQLLHGEAIGFQVVDEKDRLVIPGDTENSIILSRVSETNGYSRMPPFGSNVVDDEGVALLVDWIEDYANAKPNFSLAGTTRSVVENSAVTTNVGAKVTASDPDAPDASRGELIYSITGGNADGYFDIDPTTGQIFIAQPGLDYEVATTHDLTVRASDDFLANPGTAITEVTVNVINLLNDDSQGDGIADEWAKEWFGVSEINPVLDPDGDGSINLFEFWGNTSPTNAREWGPVIQPVGVVDDAGEEGFIFEWEIRSDLTMGTDYLVQGGDKMEFANLALGTDMELVSSVAVDGVVSKVRVKVLTTAKTYFLRLGSPE